MTTTMTIESTRATRVLRAEVKDARGVLARVWEALQLIGQARARRELLSLAASVKATRPEFAAQLRSAASRGWL